MQIEIWSQWVQPDGTEYHTRQFLSAEDPTCSIQVIAETITLQGSGKSVLAIFTRLALHSETESTKDHQKATLKQ